MMNEQIIYIVVGSIISAFSTVIFEKLLEPYIPNKKKISSYIRIFFFLFSDTLSQSVK
jgi:nucleoside permease NupC